MKILEFFKDDEGNYSSIRLIQFMVISAVLFNWTYFNVTHGTIASFEIADLAALLGTPAVKTIAKHIENKGA